MGLMIDKNGLPIGYELFSGNRFDSKTMVKLLDNLKRKFNIDKVIIVSSFNIILGGLALSEVVFFYKLIY